MSLTTTFAPSAANRVAMPRPNPDPAPVTIAILLASRITHASFLRQTFSSNPQLGRFLHLAGRGWLVLLAGTTQKRSLGACAMRAFFSLLRGSNGLLQNSPFACGRHRHCVSDVIDRGFLADVH